MRFSLFVMYVWVYMRYVVCAHMRVHGCTYGRSWHLLCHYILYSLETAFCFVFPELGARVAVNKPQWSSCLHPPTAGVIDAFVTMYGFLNMGPGDSNSNPHACTWSITEPAPWPLEVISGWGYTLVVEHLPSMFKAQFNLQKHTHIHTHIQKDSALKSGFWENKKTLKLLPRFITSLETTPVMPRTEDE